MVHILNFLIVVLLLLMGIVLAKADEPAADPVRMELIELGKLVEEAANKHQEALEKVNGKVDFNAFLEASRKSSPMTVHGERLIAFAQRHAGTHEALCALVHVIAYADGDPDNPAYRHAEEAIELLGKNELHNQHFPAAAGDLTSSISPRAEVTLRHVSQHSRSRPARAAATHALVEYLHRLARQARSIDAEPSGRMRDWVKLTYRPAILKKLAQRTPEELLRQAIELAERLRKDYGDVEQPEIRRTGSGGIVLELSEPEKPQIYGDRAEAFLFEMRRLHVGHHAPDIVGKDSQGREFRLSEYRDKVVVLTFSADWCRPCVADYPQNRKLVEIYKDRPFALLSVVADEEPRTVEEAMSKGDITWRCWFDGMDGPIARRWNIRSWPTVFVLDSQGVIRHYQPDDEKLPDLVEALVRNAEQRD
jgi:peroxiredoxin